MFDMENTELKKLIDILKESGQYRIIEQYKKPFYYHTDDLTPKLIGLFLDVETTGLDYLTDKIIELGIVCFEYSEDGRIFRILNEMSWYQDPGIPIPLEVTELTGISDVMVQGQNIDYHEVEQYIKQANLIIAHNAAFDRSFFETMFPSLPKKPWGCLMKDILWKEEGIESSKLEYIAYKFGFFYEGHRAVIDCLAGIHVLSHILPQSKRLALSILLENSHKISYKIYAVNAPYEKKDLLKKRGYKWLPYKSTKPNTWCIEVDKQRVESELEYLQISIYQQHIKLPVEKLDNYNRFFTPMKDTEV